MASASSRTFAITITGPKISSCRIFVCPSPDSRITTGWNSPSDCPLEATIRAPCASASFTIPSTFFFCAGEESEPTSTSKSRSGPTRRPATRFTSFSRNAA